MARPLNDILHDALELTVDERAVLAIEVQQSLHAPADKEIEEAWANEVDRRIGEIDRGEVEMIPWEEVRAKLHRRFVR